MAFQLLLIAAAAAVQSVPGTAPQTDYSGLGLNTKQLRAVRRVEANREAQDRANFEKLWREAPTGMKASALSKSLWYAMWKWSIEMATVGECSRFLDHDEVEGLRHSWDELKGKDSYIDGMIAAGDSAFQDSDAAGNDPGAPDELTCAVTLRSLEAGNDKAVAALHDDIDAHAATKRK
jgi:hypothetical protein